MEYKRIINLLDDTPTQPTKFRTNNWVEINDDSRKTYNTSSQVKFKTLMLRSSLCEIKDDSRKTYNTSSQLKFKTLMLRSSLCDYIDPCILVKGTVSIAAQAGDNPNNTNRNVVFKNSAPFTDYISEINNAQIDNAKHIDVIIPM